MTIICIALGVAVLFAADLHLPWRERLARQRLTPGQVYQGYRSGKVRDRRPGWSYALLVLGSGLLLLGFWRAWSGA